MKRLPNITTNSCGPSTCQPLVQPINDPSSLSNTFYNKCCPPNVDVNINCNSNTGCVMILPSQCVNYTGPYLPNINVGPGSNLTQILQSINAVINTGGVGTLQSVTTAGNTSNNAIYLIGNNMVQDNGPGLGIHWNPLNGEGTIEVHDGSQATSNLSLSVSRLYVNASIYGFTEPLSANDTTVATTQWVTQKIGSMPSGNIYTQDGTITSQNRTVTLEGSSGGQLNIKGSSMNNQFHNLATNIQYGTTDYRLMSVGINGAKLEADNGVTFSAVNVTPNVLQLSSNNVQLAGKANFAFLGTDASGNIVQRTAPVDTNIYNSDGTLSDHRFVNGNGNQLSFGGMYDFRVSCTSFATFILNDTNFMLTDGINGSIFAQGDALSMSSPGNIIYHAGSASAPNKAIEYRISLATPLIIRDPSENSGVAATFVGRVKGTNAVNPDEFVTLQQVPGTPATIYTEDGIVLSDRLVDGNGNILNFSNFHSFIASVVTGGQVLIGNNGTGGTFVDISDGSNNILINGSVDITSLNGITFSGGAAGGETIIFALDNTVLTLSDVASGIVADFTGRVKGLPAVNADEFVTKSQIDPSIPIIDNTSLVSTAITASYMNTNFASLAIGARVLFTNLSDDATKVLVVNKIGATAWSANIDTKLT